MPSGSKAGIEANYFIHGMWNTPEYAAYRTAKHRCNNPKAKTYKNYGGRGIEFRFNSMQQFISELGLKPEGYELDRINNDGHYEIGNVRWIPRICNQQNKRNTVLNPSLVQLIRVQHCLGKRGSDIAKEHNINAGTAYDAIHHRTWRNI